MIDARESEILERPGAERIDEPVARRRRRSTSPRATCSSRSMELFV